MPQRLKAKEVESLNEVISHCESLINARGLRNETYGLYESAPFTVMLKSRPEDCAIEVQHHGRPVMRVSWKRQGGPGHAVIKPGPWRAELLRLPAAHA